MEKRKKILENKNAHTFWTTPPRTRRHHHHHRHDAKKRTQNEKWEADVLPLHHKRVVQQHALDVSSGALLLLFFSSTLAGNRIRGSSCFLENIFVFSFSFRQQSHCFLLGFRFNNLTKLNFKILSFFFVNIFSLSIPPDQEKERERKEGPKSDTIRARVLVSLPPKKNSLSAERKRANDDFPTTLEEALSIYTYIYIERERDRKHKKKK